MSLDFGSGKEPTKKEKKKNLEKNLERAKDDLARLKSQFEFQKMTSDMIHIMEKINILRAVVAELKRQLKKF
jgi:hypothetical protein